MLDMRGRQQHRQHFRDPIPTEFPPRFSRSAFCSCCDRRHVVQRRHGSLGRPKYNRKRRFYFPNQTSSTVTSTHAKHAAEMAKVLRACAIAYSRRIDPLHPKCRLPRRMQRRRGHPRNPPSTLGNSHTVLAGGEPNTYRSAARFAVTSPPVYRRGWPDTASAIDSASRAPSSSARQHISTQVPTPSGCPVAKPAAASRYSSGLLIQ